MAEPLHPPRRHLRSLTSLRFFAAFWVVLYHFTQPYLPSVPAPLRNFVLHGHEGVKLFFVLSGFILAYTYRGRATSGRLDLGGFWRARFARVYPVYAFSLLVALPLTLLGAADRGAFAIGAPAYAFLLQSWWHPLIYRLQWNTPSWSLSAEAFFYLCFPLLAGFVGRMARSGLLAVGAGLLIAGAALRLAYALLDPDGTPGIVPDPTNHLWAGILYYNPLIRLAEFAFGIVLASLATAFALLFEGRPARGYAALGATVAVLIALFSFETTSMAAVFVYPATLLMFGALILLLATEGTPAVDRALALPALVLLGEASYAMYMLQRPVAALVDPVASRLRVGTIVTEPLVLAAFFGILVAASILTYQRIEIPWRNRLRPSAPPPAA